MYIMFEKGLIYLTEKYFEVFDFIEEGNATLLTVNANDTLS